MLKFKRKLIKDIYKNNITTVFSFFEKYLFSENYLPSEYKSQDLNKVENIIYKYYLIKNRELSDIKIRHFFEWLSFLEKNGYVKTNIYKPDFKTIFVYKDELTNQYTHYDPYFVHPYIKDKEIIINKDKLKRYIKRKCKTEIEYQRYRKLLIDKILYKIIPLIAILITLFLTIYSIFFNHKDQTNQKENQEIKLDTKETGKIK